MRDGGHSDVAGLSLELAGLLPRAAAFLMDFLLLWLIEMVLLFGSSAPAGSPVLIVIGAVYQWFFLTRRDGQTIGKRLMKIRVIRTDGKPLTTNNALIRYTGYYLNLLPFVFGMGLLWAALDVYRQGWHDKLARTYVIKVSPPVTTMPYYPPDDRLGF
ncbi:MAG: RDD family protein [Anaerolineae bacterium]|nr:RDD family protein [Anaerolineae bacterium]